MNENEFVRINLNKYKLEEYKRNKKPYFFDETKKILRPKTPEEEVRQKLVKYFRKNGFNNIVTEVSLTHYKKWSRGRIDIIIKNYDSEPKPIIIIECKKPEFPLNDDVKEQLENYNKNVHAKIGIITNGFNCRVFSFEKKMKELKKIPKYQDIIKKNLSYYKNDKWKRPSFSKIRTNMVLKDFKDFGWIGEDSKKLYLPFFINLIGFIQDESKRSPKLLEKIKKIIRDGVKETSFGNYGGGRWDNWYRYFMIEDENGNNQIINISVIGSLKCKNDPKMGNRKGHTYLVVAIDNYKKRHMSLELDLDKFIQIDDNHFIIWHNGRLTSGKGGSSKNIEVINFIKRHSSKLVNENNEIVLGRFDGTKEITWKQKNTREFVSNVIEYSLLRDKFRKFKKGRNFQ